MPPLSLPNDRAGAVLGVRCSSEQHGCPIFLYSFIQIGDRFSPLSYGHRQDACGKRIKSAGMADLFLTDNAANRGYYVMGSNASRLVNDDEPVHWSEGLLQVCEDLLPDVVKGALNRTSGSIVMPTASEGGCQT